MLQSTFSQAKEKHWMRCKNFLTFYRKQIEMGDEILAILVHHLALMSKGIRVSCAD